MAGETRIFTDVDYERDGKQVDWLYLPHSVTRSAYGAIAMPVACIRNGEGPSALLMAGNHGDEYEGQVVLSHLIRELQPEDVRGRVIVLPAANFPAAMAGVRVSPIDGVNLNRTFPGRPDGSITEQIAHYIDAELLPRVRYWLDLHSGGSSLDYVPFCSVHLGPDEAWNREALELLQAFGMPMSLVWAFSGDSGLSAWSAHERGVIQLGGEYGGAGTVDVDGVQRVRQGVLRMLKTTGILTNEAKFPTEPPPAQPRRVEIMGRDYYVYAPEAGLFEPARRLGEAVRKGDLCGVVHFIDDPAREPVPCHFRHDGIYVCKRQPGRVERGDCVAHLATEIR